MTTLKPGTLMETEKALATVTVNLKPITVEESQTYAQSIIDEYAGWATILMRVVESKHLYAIIGTKKYLEFDAWQLIGTFDHAYADTKDVESIREGGQIIGYICRAKIIKDGAVKGAATQMCGLDSYPCRGKEGSAQHNAAISAAQTWAASKAFRMIYSAVAVLGGYAAATADEMRYVEADAPNKTEHWCETHQTNWFKRGKMRNYAHPVEGSGEWCNEPVVIKTPAVPSGNVTPSPTKELTLQQLQATLSDEGMGWAAFEIEVLGTSWAEWVKRKGTPAAALARWETWKKNHPDGATAPATATGAAGADAGAT